MTVTGAPGFLSHIFGGVVENCRPVWVARASKICLGAAFSRRMVTRVGCVGSDSDRAAGARHATRVRNGINRFRIARRVYPRSAKTRCPRPRRPIAPAARDQCTAEADEEQSGRWLGQRREAVDGNYAIAAAERREEE